jgi:hypothetical protein
MGDNISYLIIKGSNTYIYKMYKHLLKEHPSTRGKMIIKHKNSIKQYSQRIKKYKKYG